jgi:hypothetical protein
MTPHRAAPPPLAEWLVSLVAAPEQTATIVGDLLEEFSSIISRSGTAPARRWYWRQSVRTVADLMHGQVRHAPAETVAFAIGGFLLYVLVERVLQVSAQAVVAFSGVYSYMSAVPFWRAIDTVERYVLPVMVGWTVARVARGREMMAVLSVGITQITWILAIYGSWLLATTGVARINIPDFSMLSVFCPPASGPPHAGSVTNTLTLLRFSLTYWWTPTIMLLLAGAAMRRTTSSGRILGRETTQ